MFQVTINGKIENYEAGTPYLTIAKKHQAEYPQDIILVFVNGKLTELYKSLKKDCELKFVTTADAPGMQTYQRSATLMMLKAFYEVVGTEHIERVFVDFSVGKGLFADARGDFTLNQELLDRVKAKMHEYADQKIPIMKSALKKDEAIELFHRYRMHEKAELFRYRRISAVNVYRIGGFTDYYYGYMAPDTSYIRWFDLVPYEYGFVLLLPTKEQPQQVPELKSSKKLFDTLKESAVWGEKMGISTIADLNSQICKGRASELILIQEALQEKKIGQIAEMIAAQPEKKFVMIAGPSSSGKTTFSKRLSIQLSAAGLKPHPISVDNYFVEREQTPLDANGDYNFECLEAMDIELFNQQMCDLLAGKTVELPYFNFKTGKKEYNGDYLTMGEDDILVIEGLHCLNDKLSHSLPRESKFKIYISALTQLNVDEHNRIPTTDGRLIRRMVRDARTRGASAARTISMWPSVRRGEEENIFPYQEEADVVFNSALIYELSVLKQYAEPLLFGIDREAPEYLEAKRLLKFLDYFLGVDSTNIPDNSLVREFIGGGCFRL